MILEKQGLYAEAHISRVRFVTNCMFDLHLVTLTLGQLQCLTTINYVRRCHQNITFLSQFTDKHFFYLTDTSALALNFDLWSTQGSSISIVCVNIIKIQSSVHVLWANKHLMLTDTGTQRNKDRYRDGHEWPQSPASSPLNGSKNTINLKILTKTFQTYPKNTLKKYMKVSIHVFFQKLLLRTRA